MARKNRHAGPAFDDFLKEEGLYEECLAGAVKKTIALELQQAMLTQRLTKKSVAAGMGTSRSQLDRLLDPGNASVTLLTITKAAAFLGKRIDFTLRDVRS